MKIIKEWNGCKLLEPDIYKDERGYFFESFNQDWFNESVAKFRPVQDNESYSKYGVFRGMHFQGPPYAQSKLLRVVKGEIFDISLDIRKGSPTYGEYCTVILSEHNHRQFFIQKGFAHGFLCLSKDCILQYKVDAPYSKNCEGCIKYDSLSFNFEEIINIKDLIISEKDVKNSIRFEDLNSPFNYE